MNINHRMASMAIILIALVPASGRSETLTDNARAKAFMQLQFSFVPAVFHGDEFPQGDFLKPKRAEELIGPYSVETVYYNADYQIVDKPEKPGRYGAVATIKTPNREFTRYRTLYRTARRTSWLRALHMDVQFQDWLGIDATEADALGSVMNRTLGQMIERDIARSDAFARVLAGADQSAQAGEEITVYNEPVTLDRAWWLTLKRRLNGNEKKFESVSPTIPEILPSAKAPAIRMGTPQEAGMAADVSEQLDEVLSAWAADTDTPFIACVARKGVVVHHQAYPVPGGEEITTDSKFWVASISKALSGTLFMSFVDRGLIDLTDPVEKFIPAFPAGQAKTPATMHHLITHGADMDGHYLGHGERHRTHLRRVVRRAGDRPATSLQRHQPGHRHEVSGTDHRRDATCSLQEISLRSLGL